MTLLETLKSAEIIKRVLDFASPESPEENVKWMFRFIAIAANQSVADQHLYKDVLIKLLDYVATTSPVLRCDAAFLQLVSSLGIPPGLEAQTAQIHDNNKHHRPDTGNQLDHEEGF